MKTLLSNCNVIDVKNGCEILQKKDLYISDGKIQKITDHGTREIGFDVIDCTGKYALPGLINMHVHLFGTGKPSKALGGGKAQKRLVAFINTKLGRFVLSKMVEKSAKQMLLSGVTTVRSVGDLCYSDILLKKKIQKNKGGARGLRLLVSGPAVTAPGGHGDGTFAISAQEPEELKKIVENPPVPNLKFLGIIPRTKMNQMFNICDTLFMPSFNELFPMSILEAVQSQKPVVLRDLELYKNILWDTYLAGNNVNEFSELINKLANDPDFYKHYALKSQEVADYYSKENVSKLWLNFYTDIYNKNI